MKDFQKYLPAYFFMTVALFGNASSAWAQVLRVPGVEVLGDTSVSCPPDAAAAGSIIPSVNNTNTDCPIAAVVPATAAPARADCFNAYVTLQLKSISCSQTQAKPQRAAPR